MSTNYKISLDDYNASNNLDGFYTASQMGKMAIDSSLTPLLSDWKKIETKVIRTYHRHPPSIRKIAQLTGAVTQVSGDDGRANLEYPIHDEEPGDPNYDFLGQPNLISVTANTNTVKFPVMSVATELSYDERRLLFAGNERLPIHMQAMLTRMALYEDVVSYRGHTGTGVSGLVTDATSITTAGKWDTQDNSDGILSHFQEDIDAVVNQVNANGLGDLPIYPLITNYGYNIAQNTYSTYNPNINNIMIAERKLNGGKIVKNNNIQASVTANSNTMLAFVRPSSDLHSGPFDTAGWKLWVTPVWSKATETRHGGIYVYLRYRIASKIIDTDYVYAIDSIDTTT